MKKQYVTPDVCVEHISTEEIMFLTTSGNAGSTTFSFGYEQIVNGDFSE